MSAAARIFDSKELLRMWLPSLFRRSWREVSIAIFDWRLSSSWIWKVVARSPAAVNSLIFSCLDRIPFPNSLNSAASLRNLVSLPLIQCNKCNTAVPECGRPRVDLKWEHAQDSLPKGNAPGLRRCIWTWLECERAGEGYGDEIAVLQSPIPPWSPSSGLSYPG